MALILKTDTNPTDAARLISRGIQTDPHGEVYGGHSAIFDFASLTGDLAQNDEIPNTLYGGSPCTTTAAVTDVVAKKGLRLPNSGVRRLLCGDMFKPSSYGSAPSYVIGLWVTRDNVQPYGGLLAAADANNNASMEYRIFMNSAGEGIWVNVSSGGVDDTVLALPLAIGEVTFIAVYVEKMTSTTYSLKGYIDGDLYDQDSGAYYDYTATAESMFGNYGAGSSGEFPGVIHRAQMFQVDPDVFDIDEWLAAEIAANDGRFDVA